MVDANGKVKLMSYLQKLRFSLLLFWIWDRHGQKLCSASSRVSEHNTSIKNRKLSFRCHFDFWDAEPLTQTCCWDMLILVSNSFPHRRLDRAQSLCCVWGYLVAEFLLYVCCCLNSCLDMLWLRKCFSHWGGMPAVQQLMALPCSKGASCPLLFQLKTKSAK